MVAAKDNMILSGLYANPNFVGVTTLTDHKTTALMVSAKYKGGAAGFYRVNISGGVGKPQLLKRNNQYDVYIHGVSGPGAPTMADATVTRCTLEASVNDWVTEDQPGLVVDEKGNFLQFRPESLTFDPYEGESQLVSVSVS